MKILIDMNLSPQWVHFLFENGIEAVHWSSIAEATASDTQILDYAAANGFVVFTHDLDFGTLLATRNSRRPSVIQVRIDDVLPSAIGQVVLRALHAGREYLESGAILTVDPAQNRIRVLPIFS
jgi:predicted nuclease of predicted toxin-antitoxin system